MKRKLVYRGLYLAVWLALLGEGQTTLRAQGGDVRGRIAQLQAERQDAERKRLPRTELEKLQEIKRLAESNHLFAELLEATLKSADARDKIERDRAKTKLISELQELRECSWLSPRDRLILDIVLLREVSSVYASRSSRGLSNGDDYDASHLRPAEWSVDAYRAYFAQATKQILAQRELLGQSIEPYKAALSSYSIDDIQSKSIGMKTIPILHQTMRLMFRPSLTKELLYPYIDSLNSTMSLFRGELAELDGYKLMLQAHYGDQLTRESYLGYIDKYIAEPMALPYLLERLPDELLETDRARLALLNRILGLHKEIDNQTKELIDSKRRKLLKPKLDLVLSGDSLAMHRQRIVVHSRLVDSLTLKYWRRPQMIINRGEWLPHKTSQPTLTKTIRLSPRQDLELGTDTIHILLPSKGEYYLKVEGTKAAEALLTNGQALEQAYRIYMTNHIVLRRGAYLQWLDAISGAPRSAMMVRFIPQERKSGSMLIKLDKEGRHFLPKPKWGRWQTLDPSDPLSLFIGEYGTTEEQRDFDRLKRETHLWAITDRPIYKPGQTVRLVGRLSELRRHAEDTRVLGGERLYISWKRQSGDLIAQDTVQTDEWGGFDTELRLPKQLLSGYCSASVESKQLDLYHTINFRVEEYKRPNFELQLEETKKALSLGDRLPLRGRVKDFAGLERAGDSITCRMRVQRWIPWYCRALGYQDAERDSVFRTVTEADGTFALTLPLEDPKPEAGVEQALPLYIYDIEVTAQRETGEAYSSSQRITIGWTLDQHRLEGLPTLLMREDLQGRKLRIEARAWGGQDLDLRVGYNISNSKSEIVRSGELHTNEDVSLDSLLGGLPSAAYSFAYRLQLPNGRELDGKQSFSLFSNGDKQIDLLDKKLLVYAPLTYEAKAQPPTLYYATAFETPYLYYILSYEGGSYSQGVLRPKAGQLNRLELPLPKDYEPEEIKAQLYLVRDAKLHQELVSIQRKQADKALQLRWKTFRDKVRAGSEQTWTLQVLRNGTPIKARVASWMFDASLESLRAYQLPSKQTKISDWIPTIHIYPFNGRHHSEVIRKQNGAEEEEVEGYFSTIDREPILMKAGNPSGPMMLRAAMADAVSATEDSSLPTVRKDFAELAYYQPQMTTDDRGEVSWTFRFPEKISRQRVLVVATSKDADWATRSEYVDMYQDFVVRPYLPRFLREGDSIRLATELFNKSDKEQRGDLVLELFDPEGGGTEGDTAKVFHRSKLSFDLAPDEGKSFDFPLPASFSGRSTCGLRILAQSKDFSDGEQHLLPILPSHEWGIESKALHLRGHGEQTYQLTELLPQLSHSSLGGKLDIRVESNPLLLALHCLPHLADADATNTIDLASSLYAYSLTKAIADEYDLKAWLQKRMQEMGTSKGFRTERDSLLLLSMSELPWKSLLESEDEILRLEMLLRFIEESRDVETERAILDKLAKLQNASGYWSWYPGMPDSHYLTEYVMRLLVRRSSLLPNSSSTRLKTMMRQGWKALHTDATKWMDELQEKEKKRKKRLPAITLSSLEYLYLSELAGESSKARDFLLERLALEAHTLPLYKKALATVALARHNRSLAETLLRSLREHLIRDEQGIYPSNDGLGDYSWRSRRYATTTAILEAILYLEPEDASTIRGLQQWILGQKRTVSWGSSTDTAEALYSLFLGQGADRLQQSGRIELKTTDAKGANLETHQGERLALTLPFEEGGAGLPQTLSFRGQGSQDIWISLVARHRQRGQHVQTSGTNLRLERKLFVRRQGDTARKLHALQEGDSLAVGDVLVSQLRIYLDRDIDFLSLTDPRLGASEPLKALSGYIFNRELAYYYEVKDKETRFHFSRLSKGWHELQYEQRITRRGQYQSMPARLQSAYAPEYSAHTAFGGVYRIP